MITVSLVVREFMLEIGLTPLPRWAEIIKLFLNNNKKIVAFTYELPVILFFILPSSYPFSFHSPFIPFFLATVFSFFFPFLLPSQLFSASSCKCLDSTLTAFQILSAIMMFLTC
jgi:hypothetical protein